jgi:hypothetical protein
VIEITVAEGTVAAMNCRKVTQASGDCRSNQVKKVAATTAMMQL